MVGSCVFRLIGAFGKILDAETWDSNFGLKIIFLALEIEIDCVSQAG